MNQILQGDALATLKTLPSNYVQCVVTSPPYYGLRDYGCDGQIGLEETPEAYVENLTAVFREARRVLREDGTLWLNLGDSFLSGKQLAGIPWKVAFALQSDGWLLRCDIVWDKVNSLPEPVKDRPTRGHEYMFLLAKSERYFYDADSIRQTPTGNDKRMHRTIGGKVTNLRYSDAVLAGISKQSRMGLHPAGANRRSVWSIPTKHFEAAHFAVMSPELARLCILAGSASGDIVLDPFSGAGTTAYVASKLGRQYIGIELNPEYVALSQKRLANLTAGLWGFSEEIA